MFFFFFLQIYKIHKILNSIKFHQKHRFSKITNFDFWKHRDQITKKNHQKIQKITKKPFSPKNTPQRSVFFERKSNFPKTRFSKKWSNNVA